MGFNPRARVGRDQSIRHHSGARKSFNPRARVGRDKTKVASIFCRRCFNPRARVGRDLLASRRSAHGLKFQSTRPRGARRNAFHMRFETEMFQSTRPRGARLYPIERQAPKVSFNPRARVGRDCPKRRVERRMEVFQSTRPRGARRWNNS